MTIKPLTLGFLAVIMTTSVLGQDCRPLANDELTRKGYSETIVFKEKKTRKILSGTVIFNFGDQAVEDVFVEVFRLSKDGKEWNRSAGCRTDISGTFAFEDLPKGKYKVVLSKEGGWKITEIHVNVDPKRRNEKPIFASIAVGT